MKNNKGEGRGGGLLIFFPWKGGAKYREGAYLREGGLKTGFAVSNTGYVYKPLNWWDFEFYYRSSPTLCLGTTLAGCVQQK